jgi:hypothetical protein
VEIPSSAQNYSSHNFFYRIKLFLVALLIWIYEPLKTYFDKLLDTADKRMESEADRTAIALTKDIEGAMYFGQVSLATNQQIRNEPKQHWRTKLLIMPSGEYVPNIFTHPLTSTRFTSF